MCRSVIDLLACWQGQFGGHQSIGIWNACSLSHVVHMEKKKWRELRSAWKISSIPETLIPNKLIWLDNRHRILFFFNLLELLDLCNFLSCLWCISCILPWYLMNLLLLLNKECSTKNRLFSGIIILFQWPHQKIMNMKKPYKPVYFPKQMHHSDLVNSATKICQHSTICWWKLCWQSTSQWIN